MVLCLGLVLGMAHKGRPKRRAMGRYIRGAVDMDSALGTLAAKTLAALAMNDTVTERSFVSSMVANWSLGGFTTGDNIGPIMVGVAHSDYSAAEIEAWIERANSWKEADLVSREIASRKIRRVGVFTGVSGVTGAILTLNGGKPIKTKLNWILNAGQTLDVWAYNNGSAPIATTDPNLIVSGHVNIWPR